MKATQRSITLAMVMLALALTAGAAGAVDLGQVVFSGTAGSQTASNVSYCAIDFEAVSYAFQYKWDGEKTGYDMLQAIKADVSGFDFTYTTSAYGVFVTGMSYGGQSKSGDGSAPDHKYWGYTYDDDGLGFAESYSGSDGHTLVNGGWDGWAWGTYPPASPDIPTVPEPSSIVAMCSMFGLAATTLLRRRGK